MQIKRLIRPALMLMAAGLLATPALAERDFRVEGQPFAQADILDARGLASLGGEPAVLVTLTDKAWEKLRALTSTALGKPLSAVLDGQALTGPVLREPISDGVIELTGFASFEESESVAERISGKPPVPDSMEE